MHVPALPHSSLAPSFIPSIVFSPSPSVHLGTVTSVLRIVACLPQSVRIEDKCPLPAKPGVELPKGVRQPRSCKRGAYIMTDHKRVCMAPPDPFFFFFCYLRLDHWHQFHFLATPSPSSFCCRPSMPFVCTMHLHLSSTPDNILRSSCKHCPSLSP